MKLLFLILAHDRPAELLEFARTLVDAASDGMAMIHFDARAGAADFEVLREAAGRDPRLRLVNERTSSSWGGFGLVQAPLNALMQAEAEGLAPDYVILLSGACLPVRPVRQLERYLAENAGREFIEAADASWIIGGWRSERWRYRFWFDHRTQRPLEWMSFHVQRVLGIERAFPAGLEPRFGSQWWGLTWDTCRAILMDIRRAPERLDFFRTVWVPDEMVFQTYVRALVNPDEIAGFPLTHFQFTDRGKPVVYYDDHLDYVPTLQRFFLRKAAPQAVRLRAACLGMAGAADDGAELWRIGRRHGEYAAKVAAQLRYPLPGQMFYGDQLNDRTDTVLARGERPYVVLYGPPALTGPLSAALDDPAFTVLGEAFAPGEVDLGLGRDELHGLGRRDTAIRDMHPALFLARIRRRCPGVPVLRWSPGHQARLLDAALRDPAALVVACLPFTGTRARDRQLLAWASLPDLPGVGGGRRPPAGPDAPRYWRAWVDELGREGKTWIDWPIQAAFYPGLYPPFYTPMLKEPVHPGGMVRPGGMLLLPWTIGTEVPAAMRRHHLESSLAGCRFRQFPWFAPFAAALGGFWERSLRQDALPLFPLRRPAPRRRC